MSALLVVLLVEGSITATYGLAVVVGLCGATAYLASFLVAWAVLVAGAGLARRRRALAGGAA